MGVLSSWAMPATMEPSADIFSVRTSSAWATVKCCSASLSSRVRSLTRCSSPALRRNMFSSY